MYLTNDAEIVSNGFQEIERLNEEARVARQKWVEIHLPVLTRLQALPSWSHVKAINPAGTWDSMDVYLHSEHKDSPFAREVAQEFHATGKKEAGWDGDSLNVLFEIGDYALTVRGYLPATCRVEEVDEFIPAHVGKVRKVVCTGGEDA